MDCNAMPGSGGSPQGQVCLEGVINILNMRVERVPAYLQMVSNEKADSRSDNKQ